MDTNKGFRVVLRKKKCHNAITLGGGGKIGQVVAGDAFLAEIALLEETSTFSAFTVSGKGEDKRITIKMADDGSARLRKKFAISAYPDGTLRTNYTEALRLVEIRPDGSWAQWEVGIAVQGKTAYLVEQPIYNGRYYRDANDQMVCPGWDIDGQKKWPELTAYIKRAIVAAGDKIKLNVYNYAGTTSNATVVLPKGSQGRVLFFNRLQGYGVISSADGKNHYVSWKNIRGANKGLAYLTDGAPVKWQSIQYRNDSAHALKSEIIGVVEIR